MKVRHLHDWDVDLQQARRIQEQFRKNIVFKKLEDRPQLVAGADVAYCKRDRLLYGAVVVMNLSSISVVETSCATLPETFPYIPGYLSFREGPVLLKAFEGTSTIPDAVIFDGQGLAHPRGLGLATHLGLFLDLPTVGCAKSRLTGEYENLGEEKGDWCELHQKGRPIGAVVRTKKGVRPLFVSIGYGLTLDESIHIVLKTAYKYRIPEPLREAHRLATLIRRGQYE